MYLGITPPQVIVTLSPTFATIVRCGTFLDLAEDTKAINKKRANLNDIGTL
jgi:hypothetical protein